MSNETSDKKTEHKDGQSGSRSWVQSLLVILIVFGALAGFLYWQSVRNTVYIENSYLDAPVANISVTTPGSLNAVYVKEGDEVEPNTPIALVGSETLYSKDEGIVSSAPQTIGSYYSPGQTVVSIVANTKMRVVGQIDEDKGLDKIMVGQPAIFTVDAFGNKVYEGVVDEISEVSDDTGVAFSISDKRPTKQFDVYVRFDTTKYPELKSGMSAKMTIRIKN